MTVHRHLAGEAVPRYAPVTGDTEQAAIQHDYPGFLASVAEQCGAIGQYRRRGSPVVLVNAPELVRALLVDKASDLTKGDLQRTIFRAECLWLWINGLAGERRRLADRAMLVGRLEFTFPEVVSPLRAITLRPPRGVRVTVQCRDQRGDQPSSTGHSSAGS